MTTSKLAYEAAFHDGFVTSVNYVVPKELSDIAEKLEALDVENEDAVTELNALLHQYGAYIIGRMGVPYRARGVNIISVVLDAPQDAISALSGKIGRLEGVSAKTLYSNVVAPV